MPSFSLHLVVLVFISLVPVTKSADNDYDVVYGGTSAGVIAAVQAVKMSRSVVIVGPDQHLGGLSSGGLGFTDTGDKSVIGGLSRDFYHRIWLHYKQDKSWAWQKKSAYGNVGQGTPAIDGDPASGLVAGVSAEPIGAVGSGDKRVRAYCFSMCLTNLEANRIPITEPPGYEAKRYELLARCFEAGWNEAFNKFDPIPNRKTDTNKSGPDFTDSATRVRHDVGTLQPKSGQRLHELLDGLDTPTLKGLWATKPYLHDGSAASLTEVIFRSQADPQQHHGQVKKNLATE